jgi:membrane-bound lytic murein transglycosylase B
MSAFSALPSLLSGVLILALSGCATARPTPAEKHPGMEALISELAPDDAVRQQAYRELLQGADFQQRIIDLMTRPAEAKPWKDYRSIFVTEQRINDGLAFWREHRKVLAEAQSRYGVAAPYIVAIIGVETSYGRNVGSFRVIDALTTLGLYYPPRQTYFRGELKRFLTLNDVPGIGIDLKSAIGSYAGAMGLGQFMPTSIVNFAVDGDADGRIDLWQSKPDITGSVANYFKGHGWIDGAPVMRRLIAQPGATPPPGLTLDPTLTLGALVEAGYLPEGDYDPAQAATLLTLEGAQGTEHWAIFPNFRVITRYNRSPLYATAVYQLAIALDARMRREATP